MEIAVNRAPESRTLVDKLALAISNVQDGPEASNRLYDGMFNLPYYGDPAQCYFDAIAEFEGNRIPQCYRWRFWGPLAERLMGELTNQKISIRDQQEESPVFPSMQHDEKKEE